MENEFNKHVEELESHKWVGVSDLSLQFGVSHRTIYHWLKSGKIEGIKWKNRRLINVVSVFGFLLKKKCLEVSQIKQKEIMRELELKEFKNL